MPDHWLNILTGSGATAAVVGVVGGAAFAARYGRRASLTISATAEPAKGGYLIIVRPCVKAVGIFRVKFTRGSAGSQVLVTEKYP
ncbi:MAG: hypothetical protein ACRDV6_06915, partial [Acidimicrobiales bacterium]